jgi:DNA polymerase-1
MGYMGGTTSGKSTKKSDEQKTLVLLDSHAILHRAFHALPDFSSSKGEPTGALYGLSAMLITIIQKLNPDYVVACLDLPQATHRHDVYDGYKATRKKTDDGLSQQLAQAPRVFEAFHIPTYAAPGFEADDCLGTIVHTLKDREDIRIIIASGDMDTLQLVRGDDVQVFTLRKGLNDTVMYNEQAVIDRFGFKPEHMPDYKGLRGDPSDNIKGIPGIGEKTATTLIQTFGGIKEMYATLKTNRQKFIDAGIKERMVNLLEEGEDDALFSLMLATIRVDAPIAFSLPQASWRESIRVEDTLALFDELEFRSLGSRLTRLLGSTSSEEGEQETQKKQEEVTENADPRVLKEAAVMAWLLSSDLTNPTLEDVLRAAKTKTLTEAHRVLFEKVQRTGRLHEVYEHIEKPLIPVLERMHDVGVLVDNKALTVLHDAYTQELARIEKSIYAHAGREFNISSPAQLSVVLFEELHLAPPRHKKTAGGKLSTKESELEKLADQHPIIAEILEYRELSKLLSTYIDTLPTLVGEDGRIHTYFQQAGTTTGRFSSRDPNMQNIPIRTESGRKVRDVFVASKGKVLLALDYSQIELRIAAALSRDEKLCEVFTAGGDVHAAVASHVFKVPVHEVDKEMRRRAKVINFGILYGMGVNALRQNLGAGVSRDEAAAFLAQYFETYSGLSQYLERVKDDAARLGYTETYFGRRRQFGGFASSLPYIRAQAERMAINAPIQGTSADIIKKAMVHVGELFSSTFAGKAELILQVHDELVCEVDESVVKEVGNEVKRIMEQVVRGEEFGVPLLVEAAYGASWNQLTKRL